MKLEINDTRESFITFGELESLEGFEYGETFCIKFGGISGDSALDLRSGLGIFLDSDAPVIPCNLKLTVE